MNNFIVVGRITKDIELRYTPNNKAIAKITIAIANGKDDTTFLPITVFGKVAETTNQYCKKGDTMGVKGSIKNQNWEDKSGNKHYDYSFIADRITFLSTKADKIEKDQTSQTKKDNTDIFEQFGNEIEINDQFLD